MEREFDGRSSALQNGELFFKGDQTVDERCSAVKSGEVLVTQEGGVDGRSSVLKSEDLLVKPSQEVQVRRKFTEEEKEAAWDKAETIPGLDPDIYRNDQCGNRIHRDMYGKHSPMGWTVDHSKPFSLNGTYHPNNLNAMQTTQNASKQDTHPYDYDSPKGLSKVLPPNVDLRSSDAKSNKLSFKPDGTVNKTCPDVKSGEVLVTKSGSVDGRSKAVKDGRVTFKPSVSNLTSSLASASIGGNTTTPSSSSHSSETSSGHDIQTGPRGGTFYINSSGSKTYLHR